MEGKMKMERTMGRRMGGNYGNKKKRQE